MGSKKSNNKIIEVTASEHWKTSGVYWLKICDSEIVHGQITIRKGEVIPEKILVSIKRGEDGTE